MSEIYNFTRSRRRYGVSRVQTGSRQALMRKLAKGGMNVIALPEIEHRITLPALKPVKNSNPLIGSNQKKNRRRQIGKNQAEARNFAMKLRKQVKEARPEV